MNQQVGLPFSPVVPAGAPGPPLLQSSGQPAGTQAGQGGQFGGPPNAGPPTGAGGQFGGPPNAGPPTGQFGRQGPPQVNPGSPPQHLQQPTAASGMYPPNVQPGLPPTSFGPGGEPGRPLTPQLARGASETPRIDPEVVPRPGWNAPEEAEEWPTQGDSITAPPSGQNFFVAVDTGNATPRFMRATTCRVPFDKELAAEACVPLSLHVAPLAKARVDAGERRLACVDFGEEGPLRCKRCAAYLNVYVGWAENGQQWECNLCGHANETPSWYSCSLDQYGNRRDREQRAELNMGSVEFTAPQTYWTGPSIPDPVFVFVVETTAQAVHSGATRAALTAVKESLPFLPGGDLTRVGIVGFDTSLHLFNMCPKRSSGISWVRMTDQDTPSIPLPPDAWMPRRNDAREQILAACDMLAQVATRDQSVQAATGVALSAVVGALAEWGGGRMMLFASSLPTFGCGKLTLRETARVYGSDKEIGLIQPPAGEESDFYLALADRAVAGSVGVDISVLASSSVDLPVLSAVAAKTGGRCSVYNDFQTTAVAASMLSPRGRTSSTASRGAGGPPTGGPPTAPPPTGGPPGGPPGSGSIKNGGPPAPISATGGTGAAARPRSGTQGTTDETDYQTCDDLPSCPDNEAVRQIVNEVQAVFGQETGFNAVFKLRLSRGLRAVGYAGNFTKRTPAEIDLAVVDASTSIEVMMQHDGSNLNEGDVVFAQAALLYNTAYGTRRVRVHNYALHVTEDMSDIYKGTDMDAVLSSLAKLGVRNVLSGKCTPAEARADIVNRTTTALLAYRRHCAQYSAPGQLILPEALKTLPMYVSALFKTPAFLDNDKQRVLQGMSSSGGWGASTAPTTPGSQTVARSAAGTGPFSGVTARADARIASCLALQSRSSDGMALSLYGRLFPLHQLEEDDGVVLDELSPRMAAAVADGTFTVGGGVHEAGLPGKPTIVPLPRATYPSAAKIEIDGVYLLDSGGALWVYVGEHAPRGLCVDLLGDAAAQGAATLPMGTNLPHLDSELNQRVWAIIGECRKWRLPFLPVRVVAPQDRYARGQAALAFVEDQAFGAASYVDLLCDMHNDIQTRLREGT